MTDADQTYHYQVMRRAIALLDERTGRVQSLDELARAMNMSPAHFQRLFTQWVGVSPKRYHQYLQLGHSKALLRNRFTTLETAHSVGLSGTGRLHDLFVRWEAMTPGEYAASGEALTIRYGWFETPFGPALAMGTERGLCGLGFTSECSDADAMTDLRSRWPEAIYVEDPDALDAWVNNAFALKGETAAHLIGAPFQLQVWQALLQLPLGHVTTYSEIARAIGNPKAVRAVGTAVGRNPISFLIPCHRALRKSGALGGYHWGLPVKRAILGWESARSAAETDAPFLSVSG